MGLALLALITGLALLVWSAGRFVEGSAATTRYFGVPSLLIGEEQDIDLYLSVDREDAGSKSQYKFRPTKPKAQ